eukprot:3829158-Pyramimonas_sp.AAC.1
MGSSAEDPSGCARVRPPVQRFVAPQGAPPKAPVGVAACVRHTLYSASWSNGEPGRATCPTCSAHDGADEPRVHEPRCDD